MAGPYANNSEHLAAEAVWLDRLLHRAVIEWRAHSGGAKEVFKGLYISDHEIDHLLHRERTPVGGTLGQMDADAEALRREIDLRVEMSVARDAPLALPHLARLFSLTPFEHGVVILALAPELDLAYERIFAYLQDDLSRKRPTIDLALRLLCPTTQRRIEAYPSLSSRAPLFRSGVLRPLERSDAPWLARPLALDDLATNFLLQTGGSGRPEWMRRLVASRALADLRWPGTVKENLFRLIDNHVGRLCAQRLVCYLHGPVGSGKKTLAAALCREVSVPVLSADVRELAVRTADPEEALRDVFRQAIFEQSAVYLNHLDALFGEEEKHASRLRGLARIVDEFSWVTFIATTQPWHPGNVFAHQTFVTVELPLPSIADRQRLWLELGVEAGLKPGSLRWDDVAARFRLTPGAMEAALGAARSLALLRGPDASPTTEEVIGGCHMQSNQRLAKLARKLTPQRSWADLTLPRNTLDQLQEICAHLRYRRRVYEDWGFQRRLSLGKGLCALFYGSSGVGKTMAVEIIARELELETYKVDLSTVVSKYIGETEKNLSRIFDEAESSNAILFFDEADALFGKRSEVKDAHDRYANIEINYLLQRIEEFDGMVILASNLRKNIDEGFFRRMQFAVEFPMPDAGHRYRIWKQHFPEGAPQSEDVDVDFLSRRFPISGGNIKNIVLNAAFLAASNGGKICMEHLIRATRREYQKIGRVCTEIEFAPYRMPPVED
jgi:AAA+ superfamily predicted ATPase